MFLLLFIVVGTIVFSGLGSLIAYGVYHTYNMYEAADPAGFVRITQAFSSIGMFLAPALMFAYAHDRKWLRYNDGDRKPHYLLVNVTLLLSIVILPIVALLSEIEPHQIYVAADLADPHGTHRKCTDAVLAAIDEEKKNQKS